MVPQHVVRDLPHDREVCDTIIDPVHRSRDLSTSEYCIDERVDYVGNISTFPCSLPTRVHVAFYAPAIVCRSSTAACACAPAIVCRSITAAVASETLNARYWIAMASSDQQRFNKATIAAVAKRAASQARSKAAILSAAESRAKAARGKSGPPLVVAKPRAQREFNPELSGGAAGSVEPSASWTGPMVPEAEPLGGAIGVWGGDEDDPMSDATQPSEARLAELLAWIAALPRTQRGARPGSVHDAAGVPGGVQVDETAQRPPRWSAETIRRQDLARAAGAASRPSDVTIEGPAEEGRQSIQPAGKAGRFRKPSGSSAPYSAFVKAPSAPAWTVVPVGPVAPVTHLAEVRAWPGQSVEEYEAEEAIVMASLASESTVETAENENADADAPPPLTPHSDSDDDMPMGPVGDPTVRIPAMPDVEPDVLAVTTRKLTLLAPNIPNVEPVEGVVTTGQEPDAGVQMGFTGEPTAHVAAMPDVVPDVRAVPTQLQEPDGDMQMGTVGEPTVHIAAVPDVVPDVRAVATQLPTVFASVEPNVESVEGAVSAGHVTVPARTMSGVASV
jgi:hypothetical protein